jgi:hypothetical protein
MCSGSDDSKNQTACEAKNNVPGDWFEAVCKIGGVVLPDIETRAACEAEAKNETRHVKCQWQTAPAVGEWQTSCTARNDPEKKNVVYGLTKEDCEKKKNAGCSFTYSMDGLPNDLCGAVQGKCSPPKKDPVWLQDSDEMLCTKGIKGCAAYTRSYCAHPTGERGLTAAQCAAQVGCTKWVAKTDEIEAKCEKQANGIFGANDKTKAKDKTECLKDVCNRYTPPVSAVAGHCVDLKGNKVAATTEKECLMKTGQCRFYKSLCSNGKKGESEEQCRAAAGECSFTPPRAEVQPKCSDCTHAGPNGDLAKCTGMHWMWSEDDHAGVCIGNSEAKTKKACESVNSTKCYTYSAKKWNCQDGSNKNATECAKVNCTKSMVWMSAKCDHNATKSPKVAADCQSKKDECTGLEVGDGVFVGAICTINGVVSSAPDKAACEKEAEPVSCSALPPTAAKCTAKNAKNADLGAASAEACANLQKQDGASGCTWEVPYTYKKSCQTTEHQQQRESACYDSYTYKKYHSKRPSTKDATAANFHTCSDGEQNGDEEGKDCGGPKKYGKFAACKACPTTTTAAPTTPAASSAGSSAAGSTAAGSSTGGSTATVSPANNAVAGMLTLLMLAVSMFAVRV